MEVGLAPVVRLALALVRLWALMAPWVVVVTVPPPLQQLQQVEVALLQQSP